jgi:hypothetical protein
VANAIAIITSSVRGEITKIVVKISMMRDECRLAVSKMSIGSKRGVFDGRN